MEEEIAVVTEVTLAVAAVVLGFFSLTLPPGTRRITHVIAIPILIFLALCDFQIWRTTGHDLSDHVRCWAAPNTVACTWAHKPASPAAVAPVTPAAPAPVPAPPPSPKPSPSPSPNIAADQTEPSDEPSISTSPTADQTQSEAFDGARLSAEAQAAVNARQRNTMLFKQALQGFPRYALTATETKIALLPSDPTTFKVDYTIGIDTKWLTRLRDRLSGMAVRQEENVRPINFEGGFNTNIVQLFNGENPDKIGARFCIYGNNSNTCYFLPEGDYQKAIFITPILFRVETLPPVLAVKVISADEKIPSPCVVRFLTRLPNVLNSGLKAKLFEQVYSFYGRVVGVDFALVAGDSEGSFLISTTEADFRHSEKMELRPFFGAFKTSDGATLLNNTAIESTRSDAFGVSDITASPTQRDVCGLP